MKFDCTKLMKWAEEKLGPSKCTAIAFTWESDEDSLGWVDDNVRTLALVDKVIKNVGRTGLPWGILGDFNYGAKDMQGTLAEWQVKNAKVMTVGDTLLYEGQQVGD